MWSFATTIQLADGVVFVQQRLSHDVKIAAAAYVVSTATHADSPYVIFLQVRFGLKDQTREIKPVHLQGEKSPQKMFL